MPTISDSTRTTIGASAVPATVTTYAITQEIIPGFPIQTFITDGTTGNDVIAAATNAQYTFGNAGNDTLSNEGSASILIGGAGSDVFKVYNNSALAGMLDGSILDFTPGQDRIDLSQFGISSFSDLTITSSTDADATIRNESASVFVQVSGLSGLSSLNANHFIFGSGTTPTTSGGTSGDSGNNQMFGTALADLLNGLAGNDTIYGGAGVVSPNDLGDTIAGGAGDDVIYGNGGNDILYGGVGIADPNDGSDLIYGGVGADSIYGNSGNDSLYGGGAAADPADQGDLIYGGIGADYILGNGGNDVLYGGGSVADPGDQGDIIYGGVGDDTIYGNGGNDSIHGQDGNDYMHAGVGDDTYYFSGTVGVDTIAHFEGAGGAGGDVIAIASGTGGINTAAQAIAAISYSGGNAILNFGDGNSVTIQAIAENSFIESDFSIF